MMGLSRSSSTLRTAPFELTGRQREALRLLGGPQRHTMLAGGARSGKTFLLTRGVVVRALKAPESRHAILRFRANAVRSSVALDTLPKVTSLCFPGLKLVEHRQDGFFELPNGSQIWLGGLDDKERVEKILGQEYCLDPESLVLAADLRWVPAHTLNVGDQIVGFPEDLRGNQTLERSSVERTEIIEAHKYRVVTDRGETIVSAQHKFVYGKPRTHNRLRWVDAQNLKPGDWIKFAASPWAEKKDYTGGWLAGIYDGEGCISQTDTYTHCQVAQKPGLVLDAIREGLAEIGVIANESPQSASGVVNLHCAGMWQAMRLLGMVRPRRLMPKSAKVWEGRRAFNTRGDHHYAKVVSVEYIGRGPVVSLGTSTKTLIADGFLGHNCTLYFNECSQIPYSSILVARTRLAQVVPGLMQRALYDLNPAGTGHWTYREFIEGRDPISGAPLSAPDNFQHMFLNPGDNAKNLSPEFLRSLEALPEKQRRRFFDGMYVAEIDGALWTLDLIERCRSEPIAPGDHRLRRIVIGVDPSGAANKEDARSDEIGIVVAGMMDDGTAVILEDGTVRDGPSGWGKVVAGLYHKWGADRVIAERNYGGAMVEFVILTADKSIPVSVITASRGKHIRAEPVSALYEQGKVRHAGRFPEMEDQFTNFSTSGYMGDRSPDRADAAVWALTELMLDPDQFDPNKWIKAFS
ncbi:protein of unknown function DUF264 [Xanthobacter versatilis]|uniref:Hint domain-containing protein n=1 Tax=Xanthobacter autotrophicus (strain ATCC BAA-1158 / Py2) TaxID=78245 RepID=A7ILG3_XANP2|nr:protein of unknown function DUF264 [Xanthobacter autotrophicus Py2]